MAFSSKVMHPWYFNGGDSARKMIEIFLEKGKMIELCPGEKR